MIDKEGRIFLKKFKDDLSSFVDSKLERLEQDLFEQSLSRMQSIMFRLEKYACEQFGNYCPTKLHRDRLNGDGTDIVYTIFVLMNSYTDYYNREIAAYYKKKQESVRHAKLQHRKKDPKIPHHRIYLENFKKIEAYLLTEILNNRVDERIED